MIWIVRRRLFFTSEYTLTVLFGREQPSLNFQSQECQESLSVTNYFYPPTSFQQAGYGKPLTVLSLLPWNILGQPTFFSSARTSIHRQDTPCRSNCSDFYPQKNNVTCFPLLIHYVYGKFSDELKYPKVLNSPIIYCQGSSC